MRHGRLTGFLFYGNIQTLERRNCPFLTCRHKPGSVSGIRLSAVKRVVLPAFFIVRNKVLIVNGKVSEAKLPRVRITFSEVFYIANELLINEQIRDREVRLISETGEQLGIVSLKDALAKAEEKELDLVKISPNANPPVCKLMDYGKYRFDLAKREREAKKKQKIIEIKEMRLSATIDTHDLEVKAKNVAKFLDSGDKVKVFIRFKGRQLSHTDQGLKVMDSFFKLIEGHGVVEKKASMEGRNMFMILAPKN